MGAQFVSTIAASRSIDANRPKHAHGRWRRSLAIEHGVTYLIRGYQIGLLPGDRAAGGR
jgi:hypothetical protein